MSEQPLLPIAIQPVISYPREAEVGKTYLMTIDLQVVEGSEWQFEEEEYPIYCMVDSEPLFKCKAVGEPAIVLHRFGGTYAKAKFLLVASQEPISGAIRVTLINNWGVPVRTLEMKDMKIFNTSLEAKLPSFSAVLSMREKEVKTSSLSSVTATSSKLSSSSVLTASCSIQEIMSPLSRLVTVTPESSFSELYYKMDNLNLNHCLVVDRSTNECIRVISKRDVIRQLPPSVAKLPEETAKLLLERIAEQTHEISRKQVKEIFPAQDLIYIDSESSIEEAILLLTNRHFISDRSFNITGLPVLDRKKKLVGFVSYIEHEFLDSNLATASDKHKITTLNKTSTLLEIDFAFNNSPFRLIPVVDDRTGNTLGLLDHIQISAYLHPITFEALKDMPIEHIMSDISQIHTVVPGTRLRDFLPKFWDYANRTRLSAILICQQNQDILELKGIVSYVDILREWIGWNNISRNIGNNEEISKRDTRIESQIEEDSNRNQTPREQAYQLPISLPVKDSRDLPSLTNAQQQLYDWLVTYIDQNHHSPSIRQMMEAMGLQSPIIIQSRLEHLRKKGYIDWTEGQARTIRLIQNPPLSFPIQQNPPLSFPIQGSVAATSLVETFTDGIEYVDLSDLLTNPKYFALKVRGHAMIDALIDDGDIVIMQPLSESESLKNGVIVAASVDGKSTIAHFSLREDKVILQPANPDRNLYPLIEVAADKVDIQGVLVAVWRGYGSP